MDFMQRLVRSPGRGLLAGGVAGLLLIAAGACSDPFASSPITFASLTLTSAAGDPVGQGRSAEYTLSDGNWMVDADAERNVVTVQVSGEVWTWSLTFSAPSGERLRTGSYAGAVRYPPNSLSEPTLYVHGTSAPSCHTISGRFEILDIAWSPSGSIRRLHATFEQYCNGQSAALTGEVLVQT